MLKEEIKKLLHKRKEINQQNDIQTQLLWDKEIEVLSQSLSDTIEYIKNCS